MLEHNNCCILINNYGIKFNFCLITENILKSTGSKIAVCEFNSEAAFYSCPTLEFFCVINSNSRDFAIFKALIFCLFNNNITTIGYECYGILIYRIPFTCNIINALTYNFVSVIEFNVALLIPTCNLLAADFCRNIGFFNLIGVCLVFNLYYRIKTAFDRLIAVINIEVICLTNSATTC